MRIATSGCVLRLSEIMLRCRGELERGTRWPGRPSLPPKLGWGTSGRETLTRGGGEVTPRRQPHPFLSAVRSGVRGAFFHAEPHVEELGHSCLFGA